MEGILKGVERRMELERTRGAHYAVAEAVESVVRKVEEEERKRRRDERRRLESERAEAAEKWRLAAGAAPSASYLQAAGVAPWAPTHYPPPTASANRAHPSWRAPAWTMARYARYNQWARMHGAALPGPPAAAPGPRPPARPAATRPTAAMALPATKRRRRRATFVVLTVVDAERATFDFPPSRPRAGDAERLRPGDVVLTINGRGVGTWGTFGAACRAVRGGATPGDDGVVRCVLGVARRKDAVVPGGPAVAGGSAPAAVVPGGSAARGSSPAAKPAGATADDGPPAPAPSAPAPLPAIPYGPFDREGRFTVAEWGALVRGLSTLPHRLYSGMALVSASRKRRQLSGTEGVGEGRWCAGPSAEITIFLNNRLPSRPLGRN